MDEPSLTDDQIYEELRIYFPSLFSQEAMDQGITKEYIVRAYKEDTTGGILREAENVVLKNIELKRIKSLDELRDFPLSLSSGSYSPPGNLFSLLPNDVLSKIGAYSGKIGGLGVTKSTQKKVRATRGSPLYWKENVELLFGFELPDYQNVIWKELYQVLKNTEQYDPSTDRDLNFKLNKADDSKSILYFKATCLNYTLILAILDSHFRMDKTNGMYVIVAFLKNAPESLGYLLQDQTITADTFDQLVERIPYCKSFKCVQLICDDNRSIFHDDVDYMRISSSKGYLNIFKFLWNHPKIKTRSLSIVDRCCRRYFDLDMSTHIESLSADDEEAKLEILKIALTDQQIFNNIDIEQISILAASEGYSDIFSFLKTLPGGDLVSNISIFQAATFCGSHDNGPLPWEYLNDSNLITEGRKKIILAYIDKVDQNIIREAYDAAVDCNAEFIYDILESYLEKIFRKKYDLIIR